MSSPTQRSLKLLRDSGYHAEVTEHWNAFAKIRQDLFGFIDILAVAGVDNVNVQLRKYAALDVRYGEVVAVQTTSWTNVLARVKKIKDSPLYDALKKAGISLIVHGWKKNKLNRWEVKTEYL